MTNFARIVVAVGLLAIGGCKSKDAAPSTTPAGDTGAAAPADGAEAAGLALCERYKTELAAQGETKVQDRTTHPAYVEAGVICRATVKTAAGLTCHLAAFKDAATAETSAADLAGGAWPVQQVDGKVIYTKPGGTAALWCGDSMVTPEVQDPARAIVDAS